MDKGNRKLKTTIESIVDFNGVQVFEDATVDSTVTIFQKGYMENNIFHIFVLYINNYICSVSCTNYS